MLTSHLVVNYGLRYDTTFGLFTASGRSQSQNPALLTLEALHIPLGNAPPHDYRSAIAPRLGIAYSPGRERQHRAFAPESASTITTLPRTAG